MDLCGTQRAVDPLGLRVMTSFGSSIPTRIDFPSRRCNLLRCDGVHRASLSNQLLVSAA